MKARSIAPLLLALAACDGPPLIGWTAPTAENLVGEWELVDDDGLFPLVQFTESGEAALISPAGNPELTPTFVGPLSGDSLILVRPERKADSDSPGGKFHPRVRVSRDGEWLQLMHYGLSGIERDGEWVLTKGKTVWVTYRRR